ncbi:MAG: acyltransferase [Colwellia sp.]|nr:acyltransferase [Colwellia sp.]
MVTKIKNLYHKVNSPLSFVIVILRFLYYRLYGKSIFVNNSKIYGIKNIETNGVLQIGLFKNGLVDSSDKTLLRIEGKLICSGDVQIASGCRILVGKNAVVTIGNSYLNIFTQVAIFHGLDIGDHCAISWNVEFLDEDFHKINYKDKRAKKNRILIGDHVWIGAGVKILKGSVIPNGCVVASNSVVCSTFLEENTLIAGNPAKVIKSNIHWEK